MWAFKQLRERIGLKNASGRNPCLHDLRHTFACNHLLRAYRENRNIDNAVHELSIYLGHATLASTYWYLSGVPALLVSPSTALVCGVLGLFIGGILALPLGGTLVSTVVMRAMDILLAFPGILLAIAIVAMLGPGLDKGMIAIGIVSIPVFARLMRSTVLSVAQEEYVTAALAVGVGWASWLPRILSHLTGQAMILSTSRRDSGIPS